MTKYGLIELIDSDLDNSLIIRSIDRNFVFHLVQEIENRCKVKKVEDFGDDYRSHIYITFLTMREMKNGVSLAISYTCLNGWEPFDTNGGYAFRKKYE
jgi:hypothetical protein